MYQKLCHIFKDWTIGPTFELWWIHRLYNGTIFSFYLQRSRWRSLQICQNLFLINLFDCVYFSYHVAHSNYSELSLAKLLGVPLEFGSSVNPVPTRGGRFAHHITGSTPGSKNLTTSLLLNDARCCYYVLLRMLIISQKLTYMHTLKQWFMP